LSNIEYYHFENFAVYVLYKYSPLVVTFIYAMMSVESLITSTTDYHIPGEPKVFLVKPFFFLSFKNATVKSS